MIKKLLILIGIITIVSLVYYVSTKGRGIQEARMKAEETKEFVGDTAKNVESAAKDVLSGIKSDTNEIMEAISEKTREAVVEAKGLGIVVRKKDDNAVKKSVSSTGDAAITARVKRHLANDRQLSGLDINVSTLDGKVTLSGRADSPQDVARAVDIALNTEGVKEVVSSIVVKKGG